MIAEFIVMFREGLEVAFVIGLILAYLHKTNNSIYEKHVWVGVSAGLVISIALAFAFQFIEGGFSQHEELFEGIFMIATALLVSWLILWIIKQRKVVEHLHKDIQKKLDKKETFGIFLLSLSATLREGVEAVLFMAGISVNTGDLSLFAGFLGLAASVIVGILVFEYSMKFNIGTFFKASTFVLVLLAAGLFSQGVHELQETGLIPTLNEHIYDINPPINADGSYPALHEKGSVGSIFKGLVGYDGAPSLLQALAYLSYLAGIFIIFKKS